MEVAISHRNQNTTGPHVDGTASLIVGDIVRIDGQRGLVKQQGGLFPLCKKILGFIAATCQASYKSIAKTTSHSRSARLPAEAAIQAPRRPTPARSASATVCGPAPESRRLFRTGANPGTKFCSWHESASYDRPTKQPPGSPAQRRGCPPRKRVVESGPSAPAVAASRRIRPTGGSRVAKGGHRHAMDQGHSGMGIRGRAQGSL